MVLSYCHLGAGDGHERAGTVYIAYRHLSRCYRSNPNSDFQHYSGIGGLWGPGNGSGVTKGGTRGAIEEKGKGKKVCNYRKKVRKGKRIKERRGTRKCYTCCEFGPGT